MAQLTFYLPESVEKELRRAAKRAKKSLSAYLAELAGTKLAPQAWPKSFVATFGGWQGKFPRIERQAYEQRDEL